MRRLLFGLLFVGLPHGMFAQQTRVFGRGIVNAASFMQAGLPAGSIARGSLFSIFGQRIGPTSSPTLTFPLSTNLGGVSGQATQANTPATPPPALLTPAHANPLLPPTPPPEP